MTGRAWRIAAALGLALLCAGCDLGPDYHRPPLDVPAGWQQPTGAAAWPAADWWRGFGSTELDQYMDEAERANYDLAAAVARIREADAQLRIAGAALLPTISLGAGVNSEQVRSGSGVFNGTFYEAAPAASYELDFWGKNRASVEAARASALASRYDREVVNLTVVTGVANTYFQILAFEDRLRVATQNLANAESVLNGILAQQRAGTATELDVVQQQTVVAAQRAAIPPLQQQLQQNINALAILIGKPPEQVKVADGSLETLRVPVVAPGLPTALLERRPDVREAEAQLVAANANIKVARAQFFPDFTLTATGGYESLALHTFLKPESGIYDLAASVTQPIFTGGSLEGQLQFSKARYDELLADYQKAAISAFSDVENGLIAARKTAEQTADEQETVVAAREAYRISTVQYRAGTVTLLTVLNTENALFPDEDTLVQDKLASLEAVVGLFQALGGGWTDPVATAEAKPAPH